MESQAPTITGTPPSKAQREECWSAKDAYWSCLRTLGDDDKCSSSRQDFEGKCSKTWVRHFDRQKEFQKFKYQAEQRRLEKEREKESGEAADSGATDS